LDAHRAWDGRKRDEELTGNGKQGAATAKPTDAFKDTAKLQKDLCEAADNLRANSKLTSSDYFMPVLGVIFLRHAANRFEAAYRQIEADNAIGKMPRRKVFPADYTSQRSLFLSQNAQFDWIMDQASISGTSLSPAQMGPRKNPGLQRYPKTDRVCSPKPDHQPVAGAACANTAGKVSESILARAKQ